MKINVEDMPGKLLSLVQSVTVGAIIGLLLLTVFDTRDANIITMIGLISMFTYTLLLSTSLFNTKLVRGIILISLALLSNFYVVSSIPVVAGVVGVISPVVTEVMVGSLYINFALLAVCLISWVMIVLNHLNPKEDEVAT